MSDIRRSSLSGPPTLAAEFEVTGCLPGSQYRVDLARRTVESMYSGVNGSGKREFHTGRDLGGVHLTPLELATELNATTQVGIKTHRSRRSGEAIPLQREAKNPQGDLE